ncbi:uncharacterized protein LOC112183906 isoform X2 [Rosa chinensis]|nr:uncharacterized protein LOC112183906 isoform X2 [Rosa chinensis]
MAAPVVPSLIVNELLNKNNYEAWSFRVETYLRAKGLWGIVEDDAEPHLKGKDKREAWDKINAEALHAIHICCGNEAFSAINGETSANKAWKTLAEYPGGDDTSADSGSETTKEVETEDAKTEKEAVEGDLQSEDERAKEEAAEREKEEVEEEGDGDEHSDSDNTKYEPLFRDVKQSKWDDVMNFIEKHPEAVGETAPTDDGKTVLHYAVEAVRVDIVKKLLPYIMADDYLEIEDDEWCSALDYCSMLPDKDEMVEIAKCLVQKKEELSAGGVDYPYLLVEAFINGRPKMADYLYKVTPLKTDDTHAAALISLSFGTKRFDIACDLIQRYPSLAVAEDFSEKSPLNVLACTPSAFLSGSELKFWEKWIYHGIYIKPSPTIKSETIDEDNKGKPTATPDAISIDVVPTQGDGKDNYKQSGLIRSGINRIYHMKLNHVRSLEILSCMCKVLTTEEMKSLDEKQEKFVETAIVQAAERGLVEFMTHIFRVNPNLVKTLDDKGRNLFQVAVECRQAKVFNLIHALTKDTKKDVMSLTDNDDNNMLHMMGLFSPFAQTNRIRGAALQMQKELQWFQELENMARPEDLEAVNDTHDMKPRDFFSKNHIELVKEGEKSMKETATSCTVVCALIVTMMFAAAFTVPGGNEDDGDPVLLKRRAFRVFIVADAISLFTSTTSVMLFLGILTSRYAEEDFLISLPRKMILGLLTLFLSVAAMMIAFAAALFLMLPKDSWIAVPTNLVTGIPIASFIWMQFPYLMEIFISTYMPGIFDRNVELNLGKIRFKA